MVSAKSDRTRSAYALTKNVFDCKIAAYLVNPLKSDYAVTDIAEENYVQLPIRTTQWTSSFKEKDYRALVKELYTGRITVSSDVSAMPETSVHVTDHGRIQ